MSLAHLVLADGAVFTGRSLGALRDSIGEVVFNTGMTGYQEILSDPSYAGQIVLLTYPLIGNYGVNEDDFESDRLQPAGLIVREACEHPSNWRSRKSLDQFLQERAMVGIQGVDTRAITKHIRELGATMGKITTGSPQEALQALKAVQPYGERDFVGHVSTKAPYAWGYSGKEPVGSFVEGYRLHVVVLDCGLKYNILRRFAALGVRSTVLPSTTTAEEILAWEPDGVVLSPGPGDPARLNHMVEQVQSLLGKKPIFGICLGHQILCQALGAHTFKLKFGHRGSNHPVKDLLDNTVTITSQNHGYAVEPCSLSKEAMVTQVNLNDHTVEGIHAHRLHAWSIQYHPEAAPGPWDSRKYFNHFVENMLSTSGGLS